LFFVKSICESFPLPGQGLQGVEVSHEAVQASSVGLTSRGEPPVLLQPLREIRQLDLMLDANIRD
jgi:hypothetical protein